MRCAHHSQRKPPPGEERPRPGPERGRLAHISPAARSDSAIGGNLPRFPCQFRANPLISQPTDKSNSTGLLAPYHGRSPAHPPPRGGGRGGKTKGPRENSLD